MVWLPPAEAVGKGSTVIDCATGEISVLQICGEAPDERLVMVMVVVPELVSGTVVNVPVPAVVTAMVGFAEPVFAPLSV
jgi:hypothetical protein